MRFCQQQKKLEAYRGEYNMQTNKNRICYDDWTTDSSIWGDSENLEDWVNAKDSWEDDPIFANIDLDTWEQMQCTLSYINIVKNIIADNNDFMSLDFESRTDWGE